MTSNTATSGDGDGRGGDDKKYGVAPITVTHPQDVDPHSIRLFREPPWILRLTLEGDRSYTRVKIVRASPLSHPRRYISLLDAKDEEICMIEDLGEVGEEMRQLIHEELDRRYLTSTVERVNSVRNEFGTSYWEVETHRGRREFVVQNVSENAQWLGDHRLLFIDVDGNRFEVPRVDRLDKRSIGLIEQVL